MHKQYSHVGLLYIDSVVIVEKQTNWGSRTHVAISKKIRNRYFEAAVKTYPINELYEDTTLLLILCCWEELYNWVYHRRITLSVFGRIITSLQSDCVCGN